MGQQSARVVHLRPRDQSLCSVAWELISLAVVNQRAFGAQYEAGTRVPFLEPSHAVAQVASCLEFGILNRIDRNIR